MMNRLHVRIANLRQEGLTYREIEEELGLGTGNGTYAYRACKRLGLA